MLNTEDRTAIEGLFQRLRDVARRAGPRDPDAEALIREELALQPAAPYYMAQTVLVQEHALGVAERRIRELEAELQNGGRRELQRQDRARGPWDRDDRANYGERGGGGFLAGAAQTALGVTGGMLIGSAIASMFGVGAAQAAETSASQPNQDNAVENDDPGNDAGNDDFGDGGDFGGFDGGGFDMGGDF